MKKLLVLALMAAAVVSASAQGRVTFATASPTANASFSTGADSPLGNVLVSGSGATATIRADLFWTAGTTTVGVDASSLNMSGNLNQAFLTGAGAGFFAGGTKTLVGAAAGEAIVAQIRVWDTAFGNYEAARQAQGAHWGSSFLFVITPTAAPTAAPNLPLGTAAFALNYNPVPEPSSMALAGLGAASLLIFRRRNK